MGTPGTGVAVLTGRSEGLLIPWRSVLNEVSNTPKPLTHSQSERGVERGGEAGSIRMERVEDLYCI